MCVEKRASSPYSSLTAMKNEREGERVAGVLSLSLVCKGEGGRMRMKIFIDFQWRNGRFGYRVAAGAPGQPAFRAIVDLAPHAYIYVCLYALTSFSGFFFFYLF